MLSLPSSSRALLAEKLIERIEATDPLIQATWTTEGKNAFKKLSVFYGSARRYILWKQA